MRLFEKVVKKLENASELVIVNFFVWRLYTHTLTLLDFFFFFLIWRRKKTNKKWHNDCLNLAKDIFNYRSKKKVSLISLLLLH